MNVSVLVCTYGDDWWKERAKRALDSAEGQDADWIVGYHHPDKTLAQVRNAAAQDAPTEWLCFLDGDDELAPGYIAAMAAGLYLHGALIEKPLLVPAVQYVNESGVPVSHAEIPAWGRPIEDVNCACIGTLIRRDLFLDVGGFRELPIYEDWDLWLRCLRAGAELAPVPNAIYRAHVRTASRNVPTDAGATYHSIREEHLRTRGA